MWAVFPMPRGNAGHSSTRINAGALAHGPLCRLVFLHPVLIRGSGGTGRFLCVFHAMHARTRTVFCAPNRLFLEPPGKKSRKLRIRTADLPKNVALSYNRLFFAVTYRDPLVPGGAQTGRRTPNPARTKPQNPGPLSVGRQSCIKEG
mgnify:CR=1 FL=1